MADVMENIAAYEAMRSDLEAGHPGDWVLVHDRQLIGTYPTFNDAAQEAVARFGSGAVLDSGDRRAASQVASVRYVPCPRLGVGLLTSQPVRPGTRFNPTSIRRHCAAVRRETSGIDRLAGLPAMKRNARRRCVFRGR